MIVLTSWELASDALRAKHKQRAVRRISAGCISGPKPLRMNGSTDVRFDRCRKIGRQGQGFRGWQGQRHERSGPETVWAAYNGVAEYVDFHKYKTGDGKWLETIWFGAGDVIKTRASTPRLGCARQCDSLPAGACCCITAGSSL